jgi:hypothetical protein
MAENLTERKKSNGCLEKEQDFSLIVEKEDSEASSYQALKH